MTEPKWTDQQLMAMQEEDEKHFMRELHPDDDPLKPAATLPVTVFSPNWEERRWQAILAATDADIAEFRVGKRNFYGQPLEDPCSTIEARIRFADALIVAAKGPKA